MLARLSGLSSNVGLYFIYVEIFSSCFVTDHSQSKALEEHKMKTTKVLIHLQRINKIIGIYPLLILEHYLSSHNN